MSSFSPLPFVDYDPSLSSAGLFSDVYDRACVVLMALVDAHYKFLYVDVRGK